MFERLESAQQLCELLLWDSPALAHKCIATFKASINEDDSEYIALSEPLRTALRPILSYREWDELDAMLDDLQRLAKMRRLPIMLVADEDEDSFNNAVEDEDEDESRFDFEDTDVFFAQVNDVLVEEGFNLWSWETESGAMCVFIAQAQDRETIYQLAYNLGFTDDSGAAMRCCDTVG